jgi:hypothetical protein
MEQYHALNQGSAPVEKLLERTRAGEQLLIFVGCVIDEGRGDRAPSPSAAAHEDSIRPPEAQLGDKLVARELTLLRPAAKYLLTACDRLRRAALHDAWRGLQQAPAKPPLPEDVQGALEEARLWDRTMRALSLQHGVLHPLSEMVERLPIGEAELLQLGFPCEQFLNGEDMLAS